jgi:hypothetical protein
MNKNQNSDFLRNRQVWNLGFENWDLYDLILEKKV